MENNLSSAYNVDVKIFNAYLCISIDKTINILELSDADININNQILYTVFESIIESYCIFNNEYLFICVNDGNLHIMHLPTNAHISSQ